MIYENSERLARAMMGKKKKGEKKEKRVMEAEWRSKPLTKRERKEKRKRKKIGVWIIFCILRSYMTIAIVRDNVNNDASHM
jgi:hypothetical protein